MVRKRQKSIFDIPIKSKARAKVISIVSPAAFRKSIKVLMKGRYTVGDQRALVLARNRAKAMLNRKNLSSKERKQFRAISKIRIPSAKKHNSPRSRRQRNLAT
jgi:hypothetical protein